jgi:prevent-host-death family protein
MAFIGVRELSRAVSKVLTDLQRNGEPVIITKQGRPVAALVAVDQERLEDLVLAASPAAAQRRSKADEDLETGRAVRLADLPDEDADEDFAGIVEAVDRDVAPDVAEIARSCVVDVVGSVVNAIAPGDAEAEDVTKRVEELNAGLFTRLWKHALDEHVAGSVEPPKLAGAALAHTTAQDAANRLRVINEPLVATSGMSVDLYEATVASIVQFDQLAHAHEELADTTPA